MYIKLSDIAIHVSTGLGLNGYLVAFVCHHSSRSTLQRPLPPRWRSTIVLPYVRGLSEALRRILASMEIRVSFKPLQSIRHLVSSPKDRIPDLQRSGVVYKIPCAVCPAAYIGQTGRRLCQRLDEHKRAVKSADFNSSALAWTEGHPVDWQNVSILSCYPDSHHRLVKEAILIRTSTTVS